MTPLPSGYVASHASAAEMVPATQLSSLPMRTFSLAEARWRKIVLVLSFGFSDGHGTGIFSFENLRKLCVCEECSPHPGSQFN